MPTDEPMPSEDMAPPETASITELVSTHAEALYRYAYRLSGSAADAEDLTQQTFLIAHQKLSQLREAEKAGSWLFAILRSCFLKARRRAQPAPAGSLDVDMDQFADDSAMDDDIDRERLQIALGQLPDDQKIILLLFYFERCTYKEIAERMEIKMGTVMSRLSRAKDRLRAALASLNKEPTEDSPKQSDSANPNGATNDRTFSDICKDSDITKRMTKVRDVADTRELAESPIFHGLPSANLY